MLEDMNAKARRDAELEVKRKYHTTSQYHALMAMAMGGFGGVGDLGDMLRLPGPSSSAIRHDPDRPKTEQDLAAMKRAEDKRAKRQLKKQYASDRKEITV